MSSRMIISGLRSIEECLRKNPERIAKILVAPGKLSPRVSEIRDLAKKQGVRIEINPKPASKEQDEAMLAVLNDYSYADFDELVSELREQIEQGQRPVVLAFDGLTDPHNLGAILRTAAFMGVSAALLPQNRSVGITETVLRIASGGLEHVQVVQVTNLVPAMQALKEIGFWSVGFSEHADKSTDDQICDFPAVLVIGNEEKGMRDLVKQNCDFVVKITGKGELKSLNASVAAALAMSWATR